MRKYIVPALYPGHCTGASKQYDPSECKLHFSWYGYQHFQYHHLQIIEIKIPPPRWNRQLGGESWWLHSASRLRFLRLITVCLHAWHEPWATWVAIAAHVIRHSRGRREFATLNCAILFSETIADCSIPGIHKSKRPLASISFNVLCWSCSTNVTTSGCFWARVFVWPQLEGKSQAKSFNFYETLLQINKQTIIVIPCTSDINRVSLRTMPSACRWRSIHY